MCKIEHVWVNVIFITHSRISECVFPNKTYKWFIMVHIYGIADLIEWQWSIIMLSWSQGLFMYCVLWPLTSCCNILCVTVSPHNQPATGDITSPQHYWFIITLVWSQPQLRPVMNSFPFICCQVMCQNHDKVKEPYKCVTQ